MFPPLAWFCVRALARVPDQLPHTRPVPATPALLDAVPDIPDPALWATLAQLVRPLPRRLHDIDVPLDHPALPLLHRTPHSPDFSLVTLLSLPNCARLRDTDVAHFRTLNRLLALDLRGCAVSSYALTALARGLDPAGSGPWALRLLSLHGCPNIDNDALAVLHRFPLLSVVDLRFTRCTPAALNTRLSPLGFRPSDNNVLFHPAPSSLALCCLEKIALTAPNPISLYPCPPHSVFRVHIEELTHRASHTKKATPVRSASTHPSAIRTISSAEDTVVFIPPLWSGVSPSTVPLFPPIDRPTHPTSVSNASSFYENAPTRNGCSGRHILPLSAQAVQSSEHAKLDPLAVARSPPPWSVLNAHRSLALSNCPVTSTDPPFDRVENARRTQPSQARDDTLRVDRTRLHKRSSDAVADMVHQFKSKRPKIESEFVREKTRARASVKSRNPFTRCVKSVFAESRTNTDKPGSARESPKQAEPSTQLRPCHSLPSKTERQQGTNVAGNSKPLRPITTLKPPILPKECLPSSLPEPDLKQTRLSFAREVKLG